MNQDNYSEYTLSSTEDIYGVLRKLVLSKQSISVAIGSKFKKYQSKIINANLETLSFNLERLTPEEGNKIVSAGNRFNIEAEHQGAKISFRVDNRMSFQPEHQQYRVEFPSEVHYLQRRSCFRVEQGVNDIQIRLGDNINNRIASGRLVDLSSTGFKARFEVSQDKALKPNKAFPKSTLIFSDDTSISLSLGCNHTQYAQRQLFCGFHIVSMAPMEQRFLDQKIQQLQWQKEDDIEELNDDVRSI